MLTLEELPLISCCPLFLVIFHGQERGQMLGRPKHTVCHTLASMLQHNACKEQHAEQHQFRMCASGVSLRMPLSSKSCLFIIQTLKAASGIDHTVS